MKSHCFCKSAIPWKYKRELASSTTRNPTGFLGYYLTWIKVSPAYSTFLILTEDIQKLSIAKYKNSHILNTVNSNIYYYFIHSCIQKNKYNT